jgi:hypothetical protein
MAAILNPEGVLIGKILVAAHSTANSTSLLMTVSGIKTFSPAPGSSIKKPVEKRGAFNVIIPEDQAAEVKLLTVGTPVEIISTSIVVNVINDAGVVYPLGMERADMIEAAQTAHAQHIPHRRHNGRHHIRRSCSH